MGTVPPLLRLDESLCPLDGDDAVAVGIGSGFVYLVVEIPGAAGPCWVCAPTSARAIECVRSGRTSPWDVLHHSVTGTVEIYRTAADGSLHCSVQLCSRLPLTPPLQAAA